MKRRDILKSLSILPFIGTFLPIESIVGAPKKGPVSDSNIYQTIGVEPVINCRGTFTIIGGSIECPEVIAAIHAASGFFVQYDELAFGIGQKLADLTGAEWGMVSAGCAAGMKHVTAGCVTGGNPEKLVRIPNLTGFDKTEVVIPKSSRNVYDHAIRNIGVDIITVNTIGELEKALNPRTAMIYLFSGSQTEPGGSFSTEAVAALAKPGNIPVLIDAAAEDLTIPNVHLQRGASVVAYSGGKALCGPQCAGLLLGQKDILMSAWQASAPHHGPGRDNKVGKEEMMGMLAAVEAWIARDHAEKEKTWITWLNNIVKRVSTLVNVKTSIQEPSGRDNRSARLTISWDSAIYNITGTEIAEELGYNHRPRIAIGGSHDEQSGISSLNISTGQMQPGEDKIVADAIYKILSQPRTRSNDIVPPPSAIISGQWNVDIKFYSSKSQHTFLLEQDGRWIQGLHRGDFSTRSIVGTIEGDQVKLSSSDQQIADRVPFIFFGTLSGNTLKGEIFMGEYIKAQFIATRNVSNIRRRPISIPKGQPLSS
jgi:D-glucosaminate-6-phosphate ammonia-lyase